MSWRVAKSLNKLLAQLNAIYPTRPKISDGSVGDLKHSQRASDHNPNSKGVVQARDFTHDKATLDCNKLCDALLESKDKRIKYIIWNKFIYNVKHGFAKRPYTGANAHSHHLHLSVSDNPELYDNDSDWNLNFSATPTKPQTQPTISATAPEIGLGAKGENVKVIQIALVAQGFLAQSQADGVFGKKTEQALQRFQLANNLIGDGIVGAQTRSKLGI